MAQTKWVCKIQVKFTYCIVSKTLITTLDYAYVICMHIISLIIYVYKVFNKTVIIMNNIILWFCRYSSTYVKTLKVLIKIANIIIFISEKEKNDKCFSNYILYHFFIIKL